MMTASHNYKALLIANWEFLPGKEFLNLNGPPVNVAWLKAALGSQQAGLFREELITEVHNGTHAQISLAISQFLNGAEKEDILLLYYTGHGIPYQGSVRLCAADTNAERPSFLSIASKDILEELSQSAAYSAIVVLDCCFSSRFGKGKNRNFGLDDLVPDLPDASGVFVLASGQHVVADASKPDEPSLFSRYLTEALNSGELDADGDGYTTFNDVYSYVRRRFRDEKINPLPTRRIDASAPAPRLARAFKTTDEVVRTDVTTDPSSSWRRKKNAAIILAIAAVIVIGSVVVNTFTAGPHPRQAGPTGNINTGSVPTAPPLSGSVDLTHNSNWNIRGKATGTIISGEKIDDGLLVPVRNHTIQLTLTLEGSIRKIRFAAGLTPESTPGVSTVTVFEEAHSQNRAQISLRPNSLGQLALTGLTSQKLVFSLVSTTTCCQTAYLGDLSATSASGDVKIVPITSDLETDNTTVTEDPSANPLAITEGVAAGDYPYSDAVTFTLDSAGQSHVEQWFGLAGKPLKRFSTVVAVTGNGADPQKEVSVRIYANSDIAAGPILLRAGETKNVNVSLDGATVLRLVADSPKNSCCYQVAFGNPILSAQS